MGIISTEQLQEALGKSKSYTDEAAAGHLTIQAAEEVPDVEDAEENVLYLVPAAEEFAEYTEFLYEAGYMSSPDCMDVYVKREVDGEFCMMPLGAECSAVGYTGVLAADAFLSLDDYATKDTCSYILEQITSLESRVSDLEEQLSALAASGTSGTEDSGAEDDSSTEA